jgi:hypothetical protein
LGGSGRYERIFSLVRVLGIREKSKKIRSYLPDPPNPFSHCITPFFCHLLRTFGQPRIGCLTWLRTQEEAFEQIIENEYADQYRALDKPILAIGVNFNTKNRKMDPWKQDFL